MKALFLILVMAVFAVGCGEEYLELEPIGSETESNFFQTEEQFLQGLISVYDVLTWTNGYNMTMGLNNAASDDCFAGGSGPGDQPSWVAFDAFTLNSELGPQEGLWAKSYTGIARANLVLEKIAEFEGGDPTFFARIEAETRFLRGYYYFELAKYFGNAIITLERIAVDDIVNQQQVPQSEVYAQAIEDLRAAVDAFELPATVAVDELGRVTKGAAQAMLAKALLYVGGAENIQEAADLFDAIINSGLYRLEENFVDVFDPANEWGPESIFEVQYSDNQSGGFENFPNGTEGNINVQFFGMRDYSHSPNIPIRYSAGWSFCPITPDLVEFMGTDPRAQHTILDGNSLKMLGANYTEGFQNTDYFIKKYIPLDSIIAQDGDPALNWKNNERLIRLADVYLLAAEAHALSGNIMQANQYVNKVRSRVNLFPGNPSSPEGVLTFIRNERRLELACEGHRFHDLVRWGLAAETLDGFVAGTHELLPIPQRQIDISRGVLTQNPGY